MTVPVISSRTPGPSQYTRLVQSLTNRPRGTGTKTFCLYFVNPDFFDSKTVLTYFFLLFFSIFFLASGGGLPLCPEILQYTQWLCLSSEFFHCERCRIRTRDHCLSSLERYQWATTSPAMSHHISVNLFWSRRVTLSCSLALSSGPFTTSFCHVVLTTCFWQMILSCCPVKWSCNSVL